MVAFSEMTSALTIQERAKIAACYEVGNFIILVQRRWGACKGRHYTLFPEPVRSCHAKPMTTGSVNDKTRSGRPFTNRLAEKVERRQARSVDAQTAHQPFCESKLTRHTIFSVLHKELNYRLWNPH